MKDKLDNTKPKIFNITIILTNNKKKIKYIVDNYFEYNIYEYVCNNLYEDSDIKVIINGINYRVNNIIRKYQLFNSFLQIKNQFIKEHL